MVSQIRQVELSVDSASSDIFTEQRVEVRYAYFFFFTYCIDRAFDVLTAEVGFAWSNMLYYAVAQ